MNSKLILGTVQFGLKYGINNTTGKPTSDEVFDLLKVAYNAGIRVLDTAEAYGNVHQLIGNYHKKEDNFKFKMITKFPSNIESNLVKSKVIEYLDVINVDFLDVIMFHSYDSFKSNYDSLKILNDLKSHGLINNIGVSVYTNAELENLLNEDLITVIQLPYNLLDNYGIKGDLIKKLKGKGKIVHTRSTFLQGLFFKKIDDSSNVVRSLNRELLLLNDIKSRLGCSMVELALSYCTSQKLIDNVIIGVDSMDQLNTNLEANQFRLPLKVRKDIDDVNTRNLELLNPSLWQ